MYYTINMFIVGRGVESSDVTDYVTNDNDARTLFANIIIEREPSYAELAVDTDEGPYRIVASYDRKTGLTIGDCA
jgi:hypothetical protein